MTDSQAQQPGPPTRTGEPLREIGSPDWLRSHDQRAQTQTAAPGNAQVPQANNTLGAGSLGRTSIGLAVVLVLILICGALLKRFGPYKKRPGRSLDIIASQSLGPRERVVVVEVEDTWLVLGVAPNSVNTLHTMPARQNPAPQPSNTQPTPTFGEAFSDNLRRARARFSRDGHS